MRDPMQQMPKMRVIMQQMHAVDCIRPPRHLCLRARSQHHMHAQPFASLIDRVPKECPRLLLNRELPSSAKFVPAMTMGVEWERISSNTPTEGRRLHNQKKLKKSLKTKLQFTATEWKEFGIPALRTTPSSSLATPSLNLLV